MNNIDDENKGLLSLLKMANPNTVVSKHSNIAETYYE